ncbi:FAD-dependent oxidoreductase [Gordonia McavH-238-E]|uniref:NAD(P)/FAD-dependent oxidoreductase n=1 Tax=Gordonia sp. McavH-238-E TaxID=2917736 RepID=UPI001EF44890|nr:FAD-dependent oxidoreductase [Gordonia sp. McavH-238-E]MCG7632913.1 FAD-dependent oxidoreductase [Gordonia sp. McavH-238-E]
MNPHVVVIGGGQGGATVAHTLRAYGHAGPVTLLCAESVLPYERPPLSKGMLAGEAPTPVVPENFYADENVDVRIATRATSLAARASGWAVRTDAGDKIDADTVILATGSTPRRLAIAGGDLDHVLTLGSIDDAALVQRRLGDAANVVIAGGGFVGSEVAAGLRARGHEVTIVDPVDLPIASRTAPWVARRLRQRHEEAGVRFVRDTIATIEGDEAVQAVVTTTGERLPCDLLLVAIGSVPNVEIAQSCGIKVFDGIECDERGRTSIPSIYAIGDVATWPYAGLGRVRIEHFRTAGDHAQVVAADITGRDVPPLRAPWFWTDQYQHRVEVAGRPSLGDDIAFRHDRNGEIRMSIHLHGDRVVGAVALDASREMRAVSRLIDKQSPIDPVAIADPSLDLRKAALPS